MPRVQRHEVIQPADQDYRLIPLTKQQNAIVDSIDHEWLSKWNWHALWSPSSKTFYACRREGKRGRYILMHREILDTSPEVDHKDGNGLNNRRDNLRSCTRSQNLANAKKGIANRSGYKGVYFSKAASKWVAQLCNTYLGLFTDPEQAARAYDQAATDKYGEFAHLNFP